MFLPSEPSRPWDSLAVVASELTLGASLGATAYEGRGRGGRAVTQVGNSGSVAVAWRRTPRTLFRNYK
jgi:hypothetical protein